MLLVAGLFGLAVCVAVGVFDLLIVRIVGLWIWVCVCGACVASGGFAVG